MSDFEFYFDKSFATGALFGFLGYAGASKVQRIPLRRRPLHMLACTFGTAFFVQTYMCFQSSMREDLIRRQKQFVAERQRSYVGEATTKKDLLYDQFVKELEQK